MMAGLVIGVFALALAMLLLRGRAAQRPAQMAVGVALAAGLAGYAATGHPTLPAAPPQDFEFQAARTSFETERQARLSRFGYAAAWLTFADALLNADASAMAVRGLRGAIDEAPGDVALWIGLGHALALHGGEVGVASRLAFDRAAALAPGSPQPPFFLGLTQFETGDRAAAATTWRRLRDATPPNAALDAWIARAAG